MSRISVVGAGLISPFGGLEETISALKKGRKVTGRRLQLLEGSPWANFRAVQTPSPELPDDPAFRKMRKYMSGQAFLAALAAREALGQAELMKKGFEPDRIGLFVGAGLTSVDRQAGLEILAASVNSQGVFEPEKFVSCGLKSVNPLWAFETLANMPACIISVLEGLKGESAVYTPFEDAGAQALKEAVRALETGLVDAAVVAASDSPNEPASLAQTALLGYLKESEVAAEASAALVLVRNGGGDCLARPGIDEVILERIESSVPDDPLALFLGRTMAASPVILALLASLAPELGLNTSLICSRGHRFSFEVNAA
ncbi:MAG: hypothetical protein LBP22_13730 [Deltaproteobacteria bacterium]|nr:hypothetical protein [Deltaproteobacteria bacterium]